MRLSSVLLGSSSGMVEPEEECLALCSSGGVGLSRAGQSALTGIADPPSVSKPGSMEDAIKLWLKIGNIEKLQVAE